MNILIVYLSYSGNTQEVAEIIEQELKTYEYQVDICRIGINYELPEIEKYDAIFLGTFTWDEGTTPDEVKDFVLDVGYKPDNMYIFGTGDTQFGGEKIFCGAVDRLADFYNSTFPPLKIEQSPRGTQEKEIIQWVKGVRDKWLK